MAAESRPFFISREGWYGEAGISPGQSVGVAPAERRSLCEGQMQVPNTCYPELFGDAQAEIKPVQSAIQRYLRPGFLPYNLLVFSAPPAQL